MKDCKTKQEIVDYFARVGIIPDEFKCYIEDRFGTLIYYAISKFNGISGHSKYERLTTKEAIGMVVVPCARFINHITRFVSNYRVDYKGILIIDNVGDPWEERTKNYFERNPGSKAFYLESEDQIDPKLVYIGKPYGSYSQLGCMIYQNLFGTVYSVARGEVDVRIHDLPHSQVQQIKVKIPLSMRPASLLGRVIEFDPEGQIKMIGVI